MNRKTILVLLLLSASTFALTACSPRAASEGSAESHDEAGHSDAPADVAEEGQHVELTPAMLQSFNIEIEAVSHGQIIQSINVPAEVRFNEDRVAHVSPRIPGIVQNVAASEGDVVEAGQVLATLESRELADAKSAYLSARARLQLAQTSFEREERLWENRISREQDFLDARQALNEAQIEVRAVGQQLETLGVALTQLSVSGSGASLTQYHLVAPISGTVIERHAVLGETLTAGQSEPAFVIADTSSVWVDAAVYGDDMSRVRAGSAVEIVDQSGQVLASSTIAFVNPQLGESTRTGSARIILESATTGLRPGMFVSVRIAIEDPVSRLRVPASAIQSVSGQSVVFVETDEGFEMRAVRVGLQSENFIEIIEGLRPGERIAVTETFLLKSRLLRSEMGEGHGH
tara:strand:+ start:11175 stop:12386 length:1212 start_codon:yes stop_codon:yes gene_type:complete